VGPGESVPVLEDLYLTSAEVIYAANEVKGSIQAGQVLVIMIERTDPTNVVRFSVINVMEDIRAEDLAIDLGVLTMDILSYNNLESGDTILAGSWVIYPAAENE